MLFSTILSAFSVLFLLFAILLEVFSLFLGFSDLEKKMPGFSQKYALVKVVLKEKIKLSRRPNNNFWLLAFWRSVST